jgi:hypothetical protein
MIVLENDASGAQTEAHQKRMMGEIAKLGRLDFGNHRQGDQVSFWMIGNRKGGGRPPLFV